MKNNKANSFDIEAHVTECDASYRGGTIKVDVSELFPNVEDAVMGAYQNYLGGGLRGAIVGAAMFESDELSAKDQKVFEDLKERIKRYFYDITADPENSMNDECNTLGYEKQQSLPVSGY